MLVKFTCENYMSFKDEVVLDMVAASQELPAHWHIRVGIHHGPVVAGIVGRRKYSFDLWGDTVNTAARVCSHAGRDAVVLSDTAWRQVAEHCRAGRVGRKKREEIR